MNSPTDIPRRRFGRTELAMPVFSSGGMRFQHGWKDVPLGEIPVESTGNVRDCVEAALELGINHIETAHGYGPSERQLGRVLPNFNRDDLIIQTKVGPSEDPKTFVAEFEESMDRLQLDYIDLFGIHGLNNAEKLGWALQPGGAIEKALQWKKEGRIRHLGFSTHAATPDIIQAINTGLFDYINLHWYFVNDFNRLAIEAAREQDMGVFIISPNEKGGKLFEPPPILKELCAPLHPMQFNALYCWANEGVHTLSLGISKPSDLALHAETLELYYEAKEISTPIAQRIRAHMDEQLGATWCATWHLGIPEWDRMPGEVNVKEILRLYNYAKALDMVEFAKMRYNLLGQAADWFPGHNAADFKDDEMKAALTCSPFADEIPSLLREAHDLLFDEPKKRLSES